MYRHIVDNKCCISEVWELEKFQTAKLVTLKVAQGLRLLARFRPDRFIISTWKGEKVFPHFQLQHCVMASPSSVETKLNANAQLYTNLPLSNGTKIVTGSIVRSASRRYLIYSEADFEVFAPQGRHVTPIWG